jgi:hypothetical protein
LHFGTEGVASGVFGVAGSGTLCIIIVGGGGGGSGAGLAGHMHKVKPVTSTKPPTSQKMPARKEISQFSGIRRLITSSRNGFGVALIMTPTSKIMNPA